MAGLGPAIHDFSTARSTRQVVDPRAKPGDGGQPSGSHDPEGHSGSQRSFREEMETRPGFGKVSSHPIQCIFRLDMAG